MLYIMRLHRIESVYSFKIQPVDMCLVSVLTRIPPASDFYSCTRTRFPVLQFQSKMAHNKQ